MDIINDTLEINNFAISSSGDIAEIIENVNNLQIDNALIHIVSFIHNTVLVQNLKKELINILPDAKIVLLKHTNKSITSLTIFNIKSDTNVDSISDEILQKLYIESNFKDISIKGYRNKLFSRYFTDHLTNLPNVYQLRKDLQENTDFGLVILNIDDFQTINNFYGFIVGDYIIEQVGNYLKEIIKENTIYKLSGDEFALILDKNLGFYDLKEYLTNLYQKINNILVQYQDIIIHIDLTLASSANRDTDQIFSKVSMALKYAKNKNLPFWIYEDRMKFEDEYERNLQLSAIVRDAVEASRIVPYCQAIVDNKTSKILKYECLARLIDHNGKVLSPTLFIPISKKIKVYTTVTKTIIDKSFEIF